MVIPALTELCETPTGSIRITTLKQAAMTVLWPKLDKLLAAYPDVHVELSPDSNLVDVVSD